MRLVLACGALLLTTVGTAAAQRPDTTKAKRDSVARADSLARADSIRLVRELERLQGEPRARQPGADSAAPSAPAAPAAPAGGIGPTNPRLLPDISAVGDLIGDLSPRRSTQEDGARFGVREVEVALQAAVDPFFRGDVFLGISDQEGVSIEQAYLTATALPYGIEARLGRFLMPVGKQNTTHRHDLHTIEYPHVVQRFFSPDGLKGTGLWVSKIFAPFGFYQELQLTAVDRFGEAVDTLRLAAPVNESLAGLGLSARLRNYWDLTQAANVELSASAITGRRAQPVTCERPPVLGDASCAPGTPTGVAARQSVVGADVTYRWRPLQQGLYKSFILQAEVMRQLNERSPELPTPVGTESFAFAGPAHDYTGAYVFSRYQISPRGFLGARYDWLQDPARDGQTFSAASGYYEFFPSEFSKLVVGYERLLPSAGYKALMTPDELDGRDRIILQATFALGPHKPHPF